MSSWGAPLAEPPPDNRKGCLVAGCVVAVGAAGLVAVGLVVGVLWAVRLIEEERMTMEGPPPPLVELTAAEYEAEVASGFRQTQVGVDPAQLRSIERFFRQGVALRDREESDEAVLAMLDGSRFLVELQRSKNAPKLRFVDRREIPKEFAGGNPFDDLAEGFRIVHVKRLEGDGEVLVYGLFPDAAQELRPMRWWLKQTRGEWRAFNWEESESGRGHAEHFAINIGLIYRAARAWKQYEASLAEVQELQAQRYGGRTARRKLSDLEARTHDPRVQDPLAMGIAQAWFFQGDYYRSLLAADKLARLDIRPGMDRLKARSLVELERWEEALAAAQSYERKLTAIPQVTSAAALACEELARPEEALNYWRKTLSLVPKNRDALRGLSRCLPPDDKSELIAHLRKDADPQGRAQELIDDFSVWEDEEGAAALAAWLQKESPDSYDALVAQGRVDAMYGEYEDAAQRFEQALAKAPRPEVREEVQDQLLSALCSINKPLEAYDRAPDKRAALTSFYWDYTDDNLHGLTHETLMAIIERHKKQDPEDPSLAEIEAQLLVMDSRFDEARQVLDAAIAKEQAPDRLDQFRRQRFDVLLNGGRWKEAYDSRPADFDIADAVSQLCYAKRVADARALLELHSQSHAVDPQLPLARGEVLFAEEKINEAWQALTPLLAATQSDDNDLSWRLQGLIGGLAADQRLPLSAFAQHATSDDHWAAAARQLRQRDEWPRLKELVTLWSQAAPQDSQVSYWGAVVGFELQDYEAAQAAATRFLTSPDVEGATDSDYVHNELNLLLVRSLLALRRVEEARQRAEQMLDEDNLFEPLLLVHVEAGDAAKTLEVMDLGRQRSAVPFQYLPYGREGFAALDHDPRFLPVRLKYPPPLRNRFEYRSLIVLSRHAPQWSTETLNEKLRASLPSVSIESISTDSPPEVRVFQVQRGSQRLLVVTADQPYLKEEGLQLLNLESKPLQEALAAHTAWTQIVPLDALPETDGALSISAIAAALEPAAEDLIYLAEHNRLAQVDDALSTRLKQSPPPESLRQIGESCYLYRDSEPTDDRTLDRAWQGMIGRLRRSQGDQAYRVRVRVTLGEAAEQVWFQVRRLDSNSSSYPSLVGIAEADSRLAPSLRAGEPRELYRYAVVAIDPIPE